MIYIPNKNLSDSSLLPFLRLDEVTDISIGAWREPDRIAWLEARRWPGGWEVKIWLEKARTGPAQGGCFRKNDS